MPLQQAARLAVRKYSEAVRLCPDYAEAYAHRASARFLSRSMRTMIWFGRGRGVVGDARRALQCHPSHPHVFVTVANHLPHEEAVAALRQGLELPNADAGWQRLIRSQIAWQFYMARDFAATAAEVEPLVAVTSPDEDLLGQLRKLLSQAYAGLGEYAKAERVCGELLSGFDPRDERKVPAWVTGNFSEFPGAEDLIREHRFQAAAGLVRFRMRCEDFVGAARAVHEWAAYLPPDRSRIYLGVFEVFQGRTPEDLDDLLPLATEVGRIEGYDGFLAGVLLAHAGRKRDAERSLKVFLRYSRDHARTFGAEEQWERERAERLRLEL